ncbi:MAG: hypothetical protein LUG91_05685 [Ruminococcus sp.]|nr:hypothetical protein [Ruminococcus sp.]
MNTSDFIVTLAQTADSTQTNLFPFPFSTHLIFCIISLILFAGLFVSQKKPYQIIMAVAIPFSLAIWISESKIVFYGVGLVELALLVAALVSTIIYKSKHKNDASGEDKAAPVNADAAPEGDEE